MIHATGRLFAGAMPTFACLGAAHAQSAGPDRFVRVRSAYGMEETVSRIRADIAAKGIMSQDESGTVWASWTDFAWIATHHGITNRPTQFATATGVVESITSTIKAQ